MAKYLLDDGSRAVSGGFTIGPNFNPTLSLDERGFGQGSAGGRLYILASANDYLEIWQTTFATLIAKFGTFLMGTDQTAFWIRMNRGGIVSVDQVKLGAADSGGVGFRLLRVDN